MAAHAEGGQVAEFFEANSAFHGRFVEASGNRRLRELYRQLLDQIGRYRLRSLDAARQPPALGHRARGDSARGKRGDADRAAQLCRSTSACPSGAWRR